MKMDVTEQRNQFVELRSKGWPITKIAQSLDLPIPLLCVWLSADQVRISTLRRRFQGACEAEDLGAAQNLNKLEDDQTAAQPCAPFKAARLHRLPQSASVWKGTRPCAPRKHRDQ
jgi:hypothetical protein